MNKSYVDFYVSLQLKILFRRICFMNLVKLAALLKPDIDVQQTGP